MADGADNFTIRIDNSKLMQDAANSTRIIQSISDAAEQSGKRMDESIRIDGNKISSDAAHVNKEIANIGDQAVSAGASIESAFKKAGAAIGIAFSVEQVKSFAGEMLNVRANMESLQTSFEVLLGSKEKGKELFNQLREFGANTPLELPDLSKNAQTLLGFGIQAKDVMGILKDIGNISMGDAQKMESLTLAFSQATSAGKLQGQDLLQMINAGFNPLQEIAARTGKTIAEVKDEMSKGAISADMLRQAFADAAGAGGKFDGMLDKQSKNLRGAKSNLDDAIEMTYNDIGEKLEPAVMTGINLAQTMVEHWEQIGKALIDIVAGWGTYKAAVMLVSAVQTAAINQQIAGYQALLPAKQASMDADLQELVTKGRVSQSRAMELQAIRQEIATKIREMQVTLQQANIELQASRAKYQAATRDLVVARQRMAVAQSQMRIAIAGGNAEEIAAAKTAAATAKKEVQTATIARNSASKALNTATTNRNTIATELDTLQTNANAVAKKGAATATTILTLATNGLTKAWQALKLAFMSNPIGAAITIALTAITTFMTLKDLFADTGTEVQKQASIAEQTAQSFKQKVGDAIDDEIAKVTKLKSTIHDSNATYAQRKQAIAEMQKIVPGYHASISREGKLFEENVSAIDNYIKKLQKAAMAEAAYQLQIENNKKILKLQGIAEDAGNKASATMRNFQKRTGVGLYENEGVSSSVQDQQETERGWVDKFLNRQNSTNRQIAEIQRENAKYARIERENGGHSTSNENILQRVKQHNQPGGGSATPKAGKAGKGGHTGTGSTVDYATKQEEEEHKQALQQAKQAKDDAYAIEQAAIDGMDEGEAKKLRQAALNHQKEKDQLDEQERELYEQKVEHAKALWEADPKSKGSGFWSTHTRDKKTGLVSGIAPLTDEETSGIDAQRKSEDIRYGNEVQQILQQSMDSLIEYYKNFGTLEEQRYAIAKDYDEKIAKATTEGEKKSLEAQKQRDLATAGANSLANDIDWSHTFEGVGNVLGDIARQTLEKVEKYMNTDEFKRQKPSDQKAYIDLRDKLQQETGGQMTSPFNFGQWGRIAKQVKDYQQSVRTLQEKTKAHSDAVKELQEAEKRLKNANTDMAKTIEQNNVDVARRKVNVTGEQVEAARSDTQKKQQQLNDSTTKAANGLNNFAAALQQMNSGSLHDFANGVTKLITGLVGGSKSVGKSLEELGGKIGGIIGAILQILDALGDDPKGFINGLFEKITNTVETILADLPELVGSIIKDVGSLIMGVVEGIGSMFGAKDGWINGSNAK
ncbi:MAG: tape measure protein, partial [Eubacterium sp.]